MREYFRETFPSDQSGYRTKKILDLLEKEIEKLAPAQDAEKLARAAMESAGLKLKKKKGEDEEGRDVEALFFIISTACSCC